MSCIEQGPLWSGLELLLQCQLASLRCSSTAPFPLPVTHSLMKISIFKTGLLRLARYLSGSRVQQGERPNILSGSLICNFQFNDNRNILLLISDLLKMALFQRTFSTR